MKSLFPVGISCLLVLCTPVRMTQAWEDPTVVAPKPISELIEAAKKSVAAAMEEVFLPCMDSTGQVEVGIAIASGKRCPMSMRTWVDEHFDKKESSDSPLNWLREVSARQRPESTCIPLMVSLSYTIPADGTAPSKTTVRFWTRSPSEWS